MPHPVVNVTWRNLGEQFTELAAEVEHRQKDASEDHGPIYIMVYDLQRFRDLRKADDDFGYSRYDENKPVSPSKLFVDILRDGPPVGIHTMVWCDSVNNLNRTFDRQGTKEFENRILFQMSSNDSSALIDTPAASKLGENRALYYSEEENRIEKFRPYGIPEAEWLEKVKQGFAARPKGNGAIETNGEPKAAVAVTAAPIGDGATLSETGDRAESDGNGPAPLVEPHMPLRDKAEVADPTIEAL